MTRRLVLSYLAVTVIVLVLLEIPLGVFFAQRERDRLEAALERDGRVLATLYEDSLESGTALDPTAADSYAARTGTRVVVVDAAGIARLDSEGSVPRDFSTRPEIVTALGGRQAAGMRYSSTLDTRLLFVAVPVASSGVIHGALRLTLDAGFVDDRIQRFWIGLGAIGAVVLAVMALVGWALARSVTRPVRELETIARRYADGRLAATAAPIGGPPELRTLGETLATMAVRLDALIGQQRAFVADASHQLRTPLTALRLRLENLQTRLGVAEASELDAAIEETERLSSLVTDLLQLARVEVPRDRVPTDLVALARERVDVWTAMVEESSVGLELDAPDRPLVVAVVPGAVEQILDNVLDNALAVSPPGSHISVSVGPTPAGETALTITDSGPGLDDDEKRSATQRFWRAPAATTPGTGLGLAIAQALAEASGGRLELRDSPTGRGLQVTLTFASA